MSNQPESLRPSTSRTNPAQIATDETTNPSSTAQNPFQALLTPTFKKPTTRRELIRKTIPPKKTQPSKTAKKTGKVAVPTKRRRKNDDDNQSSLAGSTRAFFSPADNSTATSLPRHLQVPHDLQIQVDWADLEESFPIDQQPAYQVLITHPRSLRLDVLLFTNLNTTCLLFLRVALQGDPNQLSNIHTHTVLYPTWSRPPWLPLE